MAFDINGGKMKINWKNILQLLNPFDQERIWQVECQTWSSGRYETFWRKSSASTYAEEMKNSRWLFVDIKNIITGESLRIKPLIPYPPSVVDLKTGRIIEGVDKGSYI